MRIYFIIFFAFIVVSCKTTKNTEDFLTPPEVIYDHGLNLMHQKKYKQAAEEFDQVYMQHPGNKITPYAEIMQAYCLYLNKDYDEVVDVVDGFIKMYPMHHDIAYVNYLRAIAHYKQVSDIYYDQSKTTSANLLFQEVINRFPNTKYASDLKSKLELTNNYLAGSNLYIANYYISQNNLIAAINRLEIIANKFEQTVYIEEALYRLAECYTKLGLENEAKKYSEILQNKFPHGRWANYTYKVLNH